jgi:hypothetical protein
MVPFALEVWLGHNTVIFIGQRPFNRTNEKRDEKGNDNEEYKQTDEGRKPTQQRRQYSNCRMFVCEIPCDNQGGSECCRDDHEGIKKDSRASLNPLLRTAHKTGHHIGEKLSHRFLFLSEKQPGEKKHKPPVSEGSDSRGL